jgi:hypothetical protein
MLPLLLLTTLKTTLPLKRFGCHINYHGKLATKKYQNIKKIALSQADTRIHETRILASKMGEK